MATTYYVNPTGSDSNSGLTTALPFKTLSKLQSVLGSGDTGLLVRGGRWKESLAPASGSSLGAYGAAAIFDGEGYCINAPVLDGGETVAGPWTSYNGSVSDLPLQDHFTGTSGTTLTSHTPDIGDSWIKHSHSAGAAQISATNTVRRSTTSFVEYYASPAFAGNFHVYAQCVCVVASVIATDLCWIYCRQQTSRAGEVNTYFGRIAADGSLSLGNVIASTTSALASNLPAGTITLAPGDRHTMRLEVDGDLFADGAVNLRFYVDDMTTPKMTYTDTSGNIATAGDPGTAGFRIGPNSALVGVDETHGFHVDDFEMGPLVHGSALHTYKATYAGGANGAVLVAYKNAFSRPGRDQNALNNLEWFWKNSVLYVRDDSGAPSATDVVSAHLGTAITAVSGVAVRDIATEHFQNSSVSVQGNNVTVQRVYAQSTQGGEIRGLSVGVNGVFFLDTNATDVTIDSCVVRDVQSDIIYMSATPLRPVVTNNRLLRVWGFGADGVQINSAADGNTVTGVYTGNYIDFGAGSDSTKGCMLLAGNGHTVTGNVMIHGRYGLACFGSTVTARNNFIANIGFGGAVVSTDLDSANETGWVVDHNVMIECKSALRVKSAGTRSHTNMTFAANTVYNKAAQSGTINSATEGLLGQAQASFETPVSGVFEDNILWNDSGGGASMYFKSVAAASTWTSDYNLIGPEATGFIKYTGTAYNTLATYVAGKSEDAHSLKVDPLFLNPGGTATDGTDYQLRGGSPALRAGVTVASVVTESPPDIGRWYTTVPLWLTLAPASGTNAGTVVATVSTTGLSVGTYTASVVVAASGATGSPKTIPVTLVVNSAGAAALNAQPRSLAFTAQQGDALPVAQILNLDNTGGGTMAWTAADNQSWLTVLPASGTNDTALTVTITTTDLVPATYSGTITLTAPGAAGSPLAIPVTYVVTTMTPGTNRGRIRGIPGGPFATLPLLLNHNDPFAP